MIRAIALHEWRRLRAGMMFWLVLTFGQLIIAWLAFAQLEQFAKIAPQLKAAGSQLGATDLVIMPTFNTLVLLLLLSAPLLAMGSLASETHSGRIVMWLSSPISSSRIVLGKLMGLWLGMLPLLASTGLTLASLGLGIELDWQRFTLVVGGMLMFTLWLASVALFVSGLFDHPAAALATRAVLPSNSTLAVLASRGSTAASRMKSMYERRAAIATARVSAIGTSRKNPASKRLTST